jgi:phosphoribosylamine-glycine ligase
MSNFLLLSESGTLLGLAMRLKKEGHSLRMKLFDSDYDGLGTGLVDSAQNFRYGETIIAEVVGFGQVMEQYRWHGVSIFAGSEFADKLEADRGFAEKVMNKAGIDTPESKSVKSWDDARKVAGTLSEKSDSNRVVLKPEGNLSGVVPSYVASDLEDALEMLKQFERRFGGGEVELTVQEFIEGVAVSTEGWFDGEGWIEGMFNHTLERKSFLAGDLGPSTGCTGNVVWASGRDPLVETLLIPLTKTLKEHRYVGPIDVNAVCNKEGAFGLEFTPRFGYDAFPCLLGTLCQFDFGAFIDNVARGDSSKASLGEGFGASVRVGLPPWPSEKFPGESGIPIRGFDEEDKEWFYPYEVSYIDEELVTSKGFGILGVVNGQGATIHTAFAKAYARVEKMKVPELQYRNDLAKVLSKDYNALLEVFDVEPVEENA